MQQKLYSKSVIFTHSCLQPIFEPKMDIFCSPYSRLAGNERFFKLLQVPLKRFEKSLFSRQARVTGLIFWDTTKYTYFWRAGESGSWGVGGSGTVRGAGGQGL